MAHTLMNPKRLHLKKFEAGGHGVFDEEGNLVGVVSHSHLLEHMRRYQEGLDRMSAIHQDSKGSAIDAKVMRAARQVMEETGLPLARAMSRALSRNPQLKRDYDAAHCAGFPSRKPSSARFDSQVEDTGAQLARTLSRGRLLGIEGR